MRYRIRKELSDPLNPKQPTSAFTPIRDKPADVDEILGTYQANIFDPNLDAVTNSRRRRIRRK